MSEIILTQEEQENLKGKKEEARQLLTNKAILEKAKTAELAPMEKKELDYITETEKAKFYVSRFVRPKVNVSENEIVEVYNANKAVFDNQNIQFAQARENVYSQLFNNRAAQIEADYVKEIVDNMEKDVVLTREDLQFTRGNSDVMKTFVINKVILENAKKNKFEIEEKDNLTLIENNVLLNYYADRSVKDKIRISQQEIEKIYNENKENFGQTPVDVAYNQIGNALVGEKATQLKQELSKEVAKEYNIDAKLAKYSL